MITRKLNLAACAAILSFAALPAIAGADTVNVCNEAENSWQGGYVVTGGPVDPNPPAFLRGSQMRVGNGKAKAWSTPPSTRRRCACAARRTSIRPIRAMVGAARSRSPERLGGAPVRARRRRLTACAPASASPSTRQSAACRRSRPARSFVTPETKRVGT